MKEIVEKKEVEELLGCEITDEQFEEALKYARHKQEYIYQRERRQVVLQHSHASLLISQGVNVAVISRRLGHKSIKTTLNIYAHMFDKDAKEAADMLDKLYNGEED